MQQDCERCGEVLFADDCGLTLHVRSQSRQCAKPPAKNYAGAREIGNLISGLVISFLGQVAYLEQMAGREPLTQTAPGRLLSRVDGTHVSYEVDVEQQLAFAGESVEDIPKQFVRTYLTGALIAVGDALTKYRYFDHAPELEMVRHLRNAVAHNNRFQFRNGEPTRSANNWTAIVQSPKFTEFEITPALEGTPLLGVYMQAGDIVDLLSSVSAHLHYRCTHNE